MPQRHITSVDLPEHLTVLVVDDDPAFRRIVRYLLERNNVVQYNLIEAECIVDAVKALGRHAFDVVTLDVRLSDCDAAEDGIKTIRSVDAHTPVVILTGLHGFTDERALAIGANAYLSKDDVGISDPALSKVIRMTVLQHRYRTVIARAQSPEHADVVAAALKTLKRSVHNTIHSTLTDEEGHYD
jgi:CheY-like chemotaxis protein